MQSIIAGQNSANTKIEKYLLSLYPGLSYSTLQKAFRKKDIRANGVRIGRDYIVMPGDKLDIYIIDELLTDTGGRGISGYDKAFSVIYEDENILIVNKKQGIPVHPDKEQSQHTLIDLVREYLLQSRPTPAAASRFQPSLCHRLDRNTGGLVIIAKNQESHELLLKKLETREIRKYYQCLVKGCMDKREETLRAFLWKDAAKSRVFIGDRKTAGSLEIITAYKVLEYNPSTDVSKLEVELVTGRTHQIRAHLANIGHPIIGDGKYGINAINRSFNMKQQALWACRLVFSFIGKETLLDYLNGKEIQVEPGFEVSISRK